MKRFAPAVAALSALAVLAAGCGGSKSSKAGAGLCPFPLEVTIDAQGSGATVLHLALDGRASITLRNGDTGKTSVLRSTGTFSRAADGTVTFDGARIWYWASGDKVPFLATEGRGRFVAPALALDPGTSRAHVVDPCGLVTSKPTAIVPRASNAPWNLPDYPLSRMAAAGLTPLLGFLVRHDHVHLDVIVDGKNVEVPAGIGLAEPVDQGQCPDRPGPTHGDCDTGHIYTAEVANSPLHTHSTSGIIHIEPDRPGTYTLGQFFTEWGVRLDAHCVGGYCAGDGKELRAYVDGKRVTGDPQKIVLGNRQEIALVYGSDFTSVPAKYDHIWPGIGCGGTGESKCF